MVGEREREEGLRGSRTSFLVAAALATTLLIGILFGVARSWNAELSHDTAVFYAPRARGSLLGSFLVPGPCERPDAAQAKPLFVSALRAWHGIDGSAQAYSDFIAITILLAFWAIIHAGERMGSRWAGLCASVLALANPWAICACYFSSYTALSIAMLALACGFMWGAKPRSIAAGALLFAVLLVNQSATVVVAALLTLAVVSRGEPLRVAQGFLLLWGGIEGGVALAGLARGRCYQAVAVTFANYLTRSGSERTEFFQAFGLSRFADLLWMTSAGLTITLLGAGVFVLVRGRRDVMRSLLFPDARLVALTLLALAAIDFRSGPKFSRTYVLLVPFACLAVAFVVRSVARNLQVVALFIPMLILHALQVVWGLQDERAAFLSVRTRVVALGGARVLANDTYLPFFSLLLADSGVPLSATHGVCELPPGTHYVIVGPNVPSVLNLPEVRTGTVSLELPSASSAAIRGAHGLCGVRPWSADLVELLPFFAHYPLLVLEDPEQTFAMRVAHRYGPTSYREGVGRVALWRIRR